MENRRKTPRFKLHQAIEMSCFSESFLNVKSVDISENGMQLVTEHPIEHEAKVYLMFEIPDGEESCMIRCEGVVMWQNREEDEGENQTGVLFTTLTDDEKKKLKVYLGEKEAAENA